MRQRSARHQLVAELVERAAEVVDTGHLRLFGCSRTSAGSRLRLGYHPLAVLGDLAELLQFLRGRRSGRQPAVDLAEPSRDGRDVALVSLLDRPGKRQGGARIEAWRGTDRRPDRRRHGRAHSLRQLAGTGLSLPLVTERRRELLRGFPDRQDRRTHPLASPGEHGVPLGHGSVQLTAHPVQFFGSVPRGYVLVDLGKTLLEQADRPCPVGQVVPGVPQPRPQR